MVGDDPRTGREIGVIAGEQRWVEQRSGERGHGCPIRSKYRAERRKTESPAWFLARVQRGTGVPPVDGAPAPRAYTSHLRECHGADEPHHTSKAACVTFVANASASSGTV